MTEVTAKAFLSYAHSDDEREGGRIKRIAEKIGSEYEFLTGTEITIFVDSAEIKWGQDFRDRLDEALQETTFFIPVLTPTYFIREECRKEMMRFVTSAQSLGLQQLLMSIRYTPVSDMVEDSPDELKAIAARMQFESWDDVRLLEEDSTIYRTRINRLASRLVELTRELEVKPVDLSADPRHSSTDLLAPRSLAADDSGAGKQEGSTDPRGPGLEDVSVDDREFDDDEPGLIDLISEFEPVTTEWGNIINDTPPTLEKFSTLFTEATEKMATANQRPNSFAAKIVIARNLAIDAEEPLSQIEGLSKDYSTVLLRLDPIIRAYIEMLELQSDPEDARQAVEMVKNLIEASKESASAVASAADEARAQSKFSRDLRPVFRRFETAMRNMVDGQELIESWGPLLDKAA